MSPHTQGTIRVITFHIGYHKTGTKFLQGEVFPQLGGCFYARDEDLSYPITTHIAHADDETYLPSAVRGFYRDLEARHGVILESRERLSGLLFDDPVMTSNRSIDRLAAAIPDARIILAVRHQGDMLRSIHAQYVQVGGTASLGAFLDFENPMSGFRPEHLEYDRFHSSCVTLFGRENVMVIPYEQIARDRESAIEAIAAHAGASSVGDVANARRNPSVRGPSLEFLRLWNRLAVQSELNPHPYLGRVPKAHLMRDVLQKAESLLPRRGKVRSDVLGLLSAEWASRFAESNLRLAEATGLALDRYGYPGSTPT